MGPTHRMVRFTSEFSSMVFLSLCYTLEVERSRSRMQNSEIVFREQLQHIWSNLLQVVITSTRSSSVVTLSRPPTISSLKITDRSFRYASPRLWNQLPDSFRQPRQSCLDSPPQSSFTCQLISVIITILVILHSFTLSLQAQNLPFQQILPTLDFFYLPDCLHDNGTGPDLSCSSFYF